MIAMTISSSNKEKPKELRFCLSLSYYKNGTHAVGYLRDEIPLSVILALFRLFEKIRRSRRKSLLSFEQKL